ncbi:hemolysin [Fusobacterium polymorphum]|uniref:hemolysin n=2 Tax=Fusobacterium nucleatum subsp. polymorphum TaxID=76857 RepID=UPI002B4C157D|nr:hemolysin [Fusobacterium polymorphum]WRL74709.1 hemolysin [Fusobacterium polymorphum]
MNKLLNDALRTKGYKGPDIKMVLTDVTDPNGPYYTDTLTNVVVFDRKELAKSNRDQILNALGHEFGHYSKEDDIDKSQDIANHTGELLEDRTKAMVSKEATEDTLAAIRNNKNVITGEEGKKLADSIPMDRREYHTEEVFGTGAYSFGGRVSGNLSSYRSFNPKTGKVEEYILTNGSVGLGSPDISIGIGAGIYWKDSREEIEKLTKSVGGSITLLGVSLGVDFLAEPVESKGMLEDFLNIKGFRIYAGAGFIPLKMEGHTSFLDYGKPINETKYESYDEYFKTKSLPSQIRSYYDNYYNGGKKNR